jgi:hypothetical protein
VQAFKLIPGSDHKGDDYEECHPMCGVDPSRLGTTEFPVPAKHPDVDTQKFKDEFVLSIDGERFDPGHGIICEVHQGLATFVADSKLKKYQPTGLYKPQKDSTSQKDDRTSEDAGSKRQKNNSNPEGNDPNPPEDNSVSRVKPETEAERKQSAWSDELSTRLTEYEAGIAPGAVGSSFEVGDDVFGRSA